MLVLDSHVPIVDTVNITDNVTTPYTISLQAVYKWSTTGLQMIYK